MDVTLAARRTAELESKLASIAAEFDAWRALSEQGKPLRKHNSQIARTTRALEGLAARIQADIDGAADAVLPKARAIERGILDVHRLWDYFRAKLALRFVPWFERPLYAVDELAWACYEPVQLAVAATGASTLKEPPLTFFNGSWSPFAAARGRAYEPERVEGARLTVTSVHDAILKLPVPVVGVPWYLGHHLPDSPVVCHEVGHAVEQDFGLIGAVEAVFRGAAVKEEHREAWLSWRSEVFADVYGCLGAGPAFVSSLMPFLAGDPVAVQAEVPPAGWGKYPTTGVRVRLNLEVLRQLGLNDAANTLRGRWSEVYGADSTGAFDEDLEPLVAGLLETRFAQLGDRRLAEIVAFDAVWHEQAVALADGLLVKKAPGPQEPRVLHAATRLAFDADAPAFRKSGVAERVLTALWDARDDGVRRSEPARPLDELADSDRSLGSALYDLMETDDEEDT